MSSSTERRRVGGSIPNQTTQVPAVSQTPPRQLLRVQKVIQEPDQSIETKDVATSKTRKTKA